MSDQPDSADQSDSADADQEDGGSIELQLTPEQQAIIRRMSGKHAAVLELTLDSDDPSEGVGRSLVFRWRLSAATGIPRQAWDTEKGPEKE